VVPNNAIVEHYTRVANLELFGGTNGQRAPATANIQQAFTGLQLNLSAHQVNLNNHSNDSDVTTVDTRI
jgi:hypothetical protein